ncbi:hypothetical protein [Aquamicrobium defluvii]|uniref:hypothetical protein n=1 Tax=Aquamicrobium defluvii TaxID=69279 RepID=UPI001AAD8FBD|nr:hypothetical protein [Aquamicrobium defluvii]
MSIAIMAMNSILPMPSSRGGSVLAVASIEKTFKSVRRFLAWERAKTHPETHNSKEQQRRREHQRLCPEYAALP